MRQILKKLNITNGFYVRQSNRRASHYKKMGDKNQDLYYIKRQKFSSKKATAKRLGIEFSIQFGELVWPTHCPILGIEINYENDGRDENSPSFDRIDPNKGYVSDNVQIISWRANRIKNDGTADEHKKIAEYLSSLLQ